MHQETALLRQEIRAIDELARIMVVKQSLGVNPGPAFLDGPRWPDNLPVPAWNHDFPLVVTTISQPIKDR